MAIGIYKITSPSGRIYIGQSIDIGKRFAYYRSLSCKTQPKLLKSFQKYGFTNHIFEVEHLCEKSELNNLERFYQLKYNCLNIGLNCILSFDDNCPAIRSEETKLKIGAFWKGKKRDKAICKKISESRKGMTFTKAHCENIRISKTGANNKRSRPVVDTKNGATFQSMAEASKYCGIDGRTLSKYLNGKLTNKTSLQWQA